MAQKIELSKMRLDQVAKLKSELPTKSAVIRALAADGWSRGHIAKALKIRYQHVRNVLITPVKNPKT